MSSLVFTTHFGVSDSEWEQKLQYRLSVNTNQMYKMAVVPKKEAAKILGGGAQWKSVQNSHLLSQGRKITCLTLMVCWTRFSSDNLSIGTCWARWLITTGKRYILNGIYYCCIWTREYCQVEYIFSSNLFVGRCLVHYWGLEACFAHAQ